MNQETNDKGNEPASQREQSHNSSTPGEPDTLQGQNNQGGHSAQTARRDRVEPGDKTAHAEPASRNSAIHAPIANAPIANAPSAKDVGERHHAPIEGAMATINAGWGQLALSEQKVADYVVREPKKTLHFTVRELARQSGSSQAAVIRFCRHLEFESFNNFKLRLARDVFQNYDERYIPDLELESQSSAVTVVHEMVERVHRSFTALAKCLSPVALEAAVDAMLTSHVTVLLGVGASGVVALDFMQKLVRLGQPVFFSQDTALQLTAASTIREPPPSAQLQAR